MNFLEDGNDQDWHFSLQGLSLDPKGDLCGVWQPSQR